MLLLQQQLLLLALTLSDLQQSYTVMLMPTARKCCLIDRRVASAAGSDASVCVSALSRAGPFITAVFVCVCVDHHNRFAADIARLRRVVLKFRVDASYDETH